MNSILTKISVILFILMTITVQAQNEHGAIRIESKQNLSVDAQIVDQKYIESVKEFAIHFWYRRDLSSPSTNNFNDDSTSFSSFEEFGDQTLEELESKQKPKFLPFNSSSSFEENQSCEFLSQMDIIMNNENENNCIQQEQLLPLINTFLSVKNLPNLNNLERFDVNDNDCFDKQELAEIAEAVCFLNELRFDSKNCLDLDYLIQSAKLHKVNVDDINNLDADLNSCISLQELFIHL